MTVQASVAVRNAQAEAWEATIGPALKFQFYSGAQSANCATAPGGAKLAEWVLSSDWSPAASAGSKSFGSVPLATTWLASGTVGHYRIVDSAGTTCHEQGSVTATGGGGDMTIDNPAAVAGQPVSIDVFTKTWPGA